MISRSRCVIHRVKKNTLGDDSHAKVTQHFRIFDCWVTFAVTRKGIHPPRGYHKQITAGQAAKPASILLRG